MHSFLWIHCTSDPCDSSLHSFLHDALPISSGLRLLGEADCHGPLQVCAGSIATMSTGHELRLTETADAHSEVHHVLAMHDGKLRCGEDRRFWSSAGLYSTIF